MTRTVVYTTFFEIYFALGSGKVTNEYPKCIKILIKSIQNDARGIPWGQGKSRRRPSGTKPDARWIAFGAFLVPLSKWAPFGGPLDVEGVPKQETRKVRKEVFTLYLLHFERPRGVTKFYEKRASQCHDESIKIDTLGSI